MQEISERTGESMASLYDRISKGSMKVDEITKSMQMATSEGGKFYQSMEKQSKTLNGQLSTLKDNADQLLGTLTQGMSEGLRDEFLPLANNMIGELQNAFETGGIQGLSDAATDMIPNLLDMMSGEFEKGITAIGKWLPKGASSLMKHIPKALSSASSVIPQITTALFEVATVVVSDLTGMLPELIPALAEGIGNMFSAAITGTQGLINGLFDGIEQMFHQGQKKIAGIWVDAEQVAKYDLKIDVSTESDAAKEDIASAFNDIREALNTDLLSPEQRNEILGMIGEDYHAIYDKLISFNLPPEDAEVLAGMITASSDAVIKHLEGLNIEVDSGTLYKWMDQADNSRIALREILKREGLSDSDIEQVVAVFDTMNGRIADKTPNIAEHIYAELTDGLKDDPEALKAEITAYLNAQDKAIEEAYNEAVSKLDPADGDYAAKLATLNAEYASAKADLKLIGTDLNTLVDTLANASTATVQSKYQLLADVETQVNGLSKRIDELAGEARTLGQQAYNIVRSGAKADEATISQAVSFKISEYKLDLQSADEARDKAIAELNEQYEKGEISKAKFNSNIKFYDVMSDHEKTLAKKEFEKSLDFIFGGVAEGEGIEKALVEGGKKLELSNALIAFSKSFANEDLSQTVGSKINDELIAYLAEQFNINPEDLKYMSLYQFDRTVGNLGLLVDELIADAESAIETAGNSKTASLFRSIIESGVAEGTKFDVQDDSEQLAVLLTSIASAAADNAANKLDKSGSTIGDKIIDSASESIEAGAADIADAAGEIGESAKELIKAATDNMDDFEGANDAGNETARGLDIALAEAVRAARERGEEAGIAFAGGYKRTMMIRSPSKVMKDLGEHTGEGLNIGLRDSLKRAVATARLISGQIATAADISKDVRVSVPGLQQEIVGANQQTATPVYLNGVQIAEIQGHNNSMQLAWQNTKAAKGVGSR